MDESKKLKKIGSEAVAADILRGWRIARPELDESKKLKKLRSDAGSNSLSYR